MGPWGKSRPIFSGGAWNGGQGAAGGVAARLPEADERPAPAVFPADAEFLHVAQGELACTACLV